MGTLWIRAVHDHLNALPVNKSVATSITRWRLKLQTYSWLSFESLEMRKSWSPCRPHLHHCHFPGGYELSWKSPWKFWRSLAATLVGTMRASHTVVALLMLAASMPPPSGSAFLMDSEQNYVQPQRQRQHYAEGDSLELEHDRTRVSKSRRMVLADYFSYPSW